MKTEKPFNYSKAHLITLLSEVEFDTDISTVQELSNEIENKIVSVVDIIAPITKFVNNQLEKSNSNPEWLRKKIGLRKRLLKKLKTSKNLETKTKIKNIC